MGFNRRKFARYVRDDRLSRVKQYLKRFGLSIITLPLDRKKRTAVHLACKHRSSYCLLHFLSFKPDLKVVDRLGNLPLHLLLKGKELSKRDCDDILQPLLSRCCPTILEISNNKGITISKLISTSHYRKCLFQNVDSSAETKYSSNMLDTSDDDSTSSDDSWYEKLHSFANEDYEHEMGKFEKDEGVEFQNRETYDEWIKRIANEHSRKHKYEKPTQQKKRHKTEEPKADQFKKLKPENVVEQQSKRHLIQKMKFVTTTNRVFSDENKPLIHLEDLPWINYNHSEELLFNVLLSGIDRSDSSSTKKCLREYLHQWHPDKFSQKCGHRLDNTNKNEVLTEVNRFSQMLNSFIQNLP